LLRLSASHLVNSFLQNPLGVGHAVNTLVLIKGGGDIGSAVAHLLHRLGYPLVIVEDPYPATVRRRMSYAQAVFDGEAELEGIRGERVDSINTLRALLQWGKIIPVFVGSTDVVLEALQPKVVVDARMRKKERAESQLSEAPLVIGLGPGFRAQEVVHVVIETNRGPNLGRVITEGEAESYTGEPIAIEGYKRERYIYAPCNGVFVTQLDVGMFVQVGEVVGRIGEHELRAEMSGLVRGITKSGVPVKTGTKVVDLDPRGKEELIAGIAERPRRIAEGVREAIQKWEKNQG
jgi:xanthine dehydrogenase accessory factor